MIRNSAVRWWNHVEIHPCSGRTEHLGGCLMRTCGEAHLSSVSLTTIAPTPKLLDKIAVNNNIDLTRMAGNSRNYEGFLHDNAIAKRTRVDFLQSCLSVKLASITMMISLPNGMKLELASHTSS
jgi:hypothetical protein